MARSKAAKTAPAKATEAKAKPSFAGVKFAKATVVQTSNGGRKAEPNPFEAVVAEIIEINKTDTTAAKSFLCPADDVAYARTLIQKAGRKAGVTMLCQYDEETGRLSFRSRPAIKQNRKPKTDAE